MANPYSSVTTLTQGLHAGPFGLSSLLWSGLPALPLPPLPVPNAAETVRRLFNKSRKFG